MNTYAWGFTPEDIAKKSATLKKVDMYSTFIGGTDRSVRYKHALYLHLKSTILDDNTSSPMIYMCGEATHTWPEDWATNEDIIGQWESSMQHSYIAIMEDNIDIIGRAVGVARAVSGKMPVSNAPIFGASNESMWKATDITPERTIKDVISDEFPLIIAVPGKTIIVETNINPKDPIRMMVCPHNPIDAVFSYIYSHSSTSDIQRTILQSLVSVVDFDVVFLGEGAHTPLQDVVEYLY